MSWVGQVSSHTWVCWHCRYVRREPCHRRIAYCVKCAATMHNMGSKWKPPRKHQKRKWSQQQFLFFSGRRPDGYIDHWKRDTGWPTCKWCGMPRDDNHPKWSRHE